jgi:hypothetical protein
MVRERISYIVSELTDVTSLGRLHLGRAERPIRHMKNLALRYSQEHSISLVEAFPGPGDGQLEGADCARAHWM